MNRRNFFFGLLTGALTQAPIKKLTPQRELPKREPHSLRITLNDEAYHELQTLIGDSGICQFSIRHDEHHVDAVVSIAREGGK